jgi:hypothetical protein
MTFRLAGRCTTCLNAPSKSLQKVHYVCRLWALRPLDGLAFLLPLEQLVERSFVLVSHRFRTDDVDWESAPEWTDFRFSVWLR